MEKSNTWEYGVLSLSSKPHAIAKPKQGSLGGVKGNPWGGGGERLGQPGVTLWVGTVVKFVKRAVVSTSWKPAGLIIDVVNPYDPCRSKVLIMPSPK